MSTFDAPEGPDAEALVRRVIEIIGNSKPMPLSTTVRVEKDEVLELLDDALDRMPQEVRQARYMLKEREEYLAKIQREADDILEAGRVGAERMVQRTEIVREAQHTAQRTMDEVRDETRRLKMEAEDYCDQKLAAFEIVLERTAKTVASGREKLRGTPMPSDDGEFGLGLSAGPNTAQAAAEGAFFDQDT